jgi:hypothetical protein
LGLAPHFLVEFRERYDLDRTLFRGCDGATHRPFMAEQRVPAAQSYRAGGGDQQGARHRCERFAARTGTSTTDVIKRSQLDESLTDNIRDAVIDFERTLIMRAVKRPRGYQGRREQGARRHLAALPRGGRRRRQLDAAQADPSLHVLAKKTALHARYLHMRGGQYICICS